jgi:hypothetical protein
VPVFVPAPTATPHLVNKALALFRSFASRSGSDAGSSADMAAGVGDDMDAHDGSTALFDVTQFGRWLTTELHWYSAHPPNKCFSAAQSLFVHYLKSLDAGIEPLITGLIRDPTFWIDNGYINTGLADWHTADGYLRQATAAIKRVNCGAA